MVRPLSVSVLRVAPACRQRVTSEASKNLLYSSTDSQFAHTPGREHYGDSGCNKTGDQRHQFRPNLIHPYDSRSLYFAETGNGDAMSEAQTVIKAKVGLLELACSRGKSGLHVVSAWPFSAGLPSRLKQHGLHYGRSRCLP